MSSDDYWIVAYKILSYLYACMKAGKKVDAAVMCELAGVNESYFGQVVRGLQDKGLVSGFHFDGLSGVIDNSPSSAYMDEPAITMDGALYVRENSEMGRAKRFADREFDLALGAAVSTAVSRI